MLRLEAGFMATGSEFRPDIDPFEAGLGIAVDMKKPAVVGHCALLRNRRAQRRKLVDLLLEGNESPAHGAPVCAGRYQVSLITRATLSLILDRPIAMARLSVEHAEQGAMLEAGCLDGRMKCRTARVISQPFADPEREQARA